MFRTMLRVLPLVIIFIQGCGYKEVEVIDYRLYFDTQDQSLVKETRRLVAYYNQRVGAEVLHLAASREDANSPIIWTQGLQDQDRKIGYGQWRTTTKQDSQFGAITGKKPRRTTDYSMAIEFDYAFFSQRMTQATTSPQWQELFVLFCHEVGHGLTMNHEEDNKSVMYKYVDGADGVKFDEYFARVRAFFRL